MTESEILQFNILEGYVFPLDIKKPIKFFNGDYIQKIDDNYKLISSKIRNEFIIGYFSTSQQVKYGRKKNGAIIYEVKCINTKLPNFIIPYKGQKKGEICIKFKYVNWDSNLPLGNIIDVIGDYNKANTGLILMNYYNIYPNKHESFNKIIKNKIENNDVNKYEKLIERKNISDKEIFSIDPIGSKDIDDALSFDENKSEIIIGIHIAQPIVWLDPDNLIDKLNYQFSTIYGNQKNYNLFGDYLTDESSLTQQIEKPAYSVFFFYNKITLELLKIEDFPSYVKIKRNYSYDDINNRKSDKKITQLEDFTKKFSDINESCELVSYWMVKCNNYIAEKISRTDFKIPYRTNNSSEKEVSNKLQISNNILIKFKQRNMESAEYKIKNSSVSTYHHNLGLEYYCHFTSPIRRIVDTFIHFIVTYKDFLENDTLTLINKFISDESINQINKLDKNTKKFHTQINFEKKLNKLNFEDCLTKVWIYKIISKNELEVYIEKLDIFKKINIYHPKFEFLFRFSNDESSDKNKQIIPKIKEGDNFEIKINLVSNPIPSKRILPIYFFTPSI